MSFLQRRMVQYGVVVCPLMGNRKVSFRWTRTLGEEWRESARMRPLAFLFLFLFLHFLFFCTLIIIFDSSILQCTSSYPLEVVSHLYVYSWGVTLWFALDKWFALTVASMDSAQSFYRLSSSRHRYNLSSIAHSFWMNPRRSTRSRPPHPPAQSLARVGNYGNHWRHQEQEGEEEGSVLGF